jgi:hypothetical protein
MVPQPSLDGTAVEMIRPCFFQLFFWPRNAV